MKRIFSALLALCALLLPFSSPRAEAPETVEYRGGIVERGRWRAQTTRARLDELTVAYLDADTRYLVSGRPATFTVHAAGGDGNYSYVFNVFYRKGDTGSLSNIYRRERSVNPSLTYTPAHSSGQYMLLVAVHDEAGEYIGWQSQIFEVFPAEAADDAETVPGKVRQLAAECLRSAGRSEYSRALWLHDWLIYNANYDTSYTYYYANGVLLEGVGVCQSYALAYDLLLHEIGIESVYLSGTANGVSHAWNLVRLDGSWYHVDCTWDDPIGGGYEKHSYFGLTDEQMALDHSWARERGVMPECTSDELAGLGFGRSGFSRAAFPAGNGGNRLRRPVSHGRNNLQSEERLSGLVLAESAHEQSVRILPRALFIKGVRGLSESGRSLPRHGGRAAGRTSGTHAVPSHRRARRAGLRAAARKGDGGASVDERQ